MKYARVLLSTRVILALVNLSSTRNARIDERPPSVSVKCSKMGDFDTLSKLHRGKQ